MDGPRFDALAKSLRTAGPRRRLLAGLLGAALAGSAGRAAADRCKADFKPCKKASQCCGGFCCFTNLVPNEARVCLSCEDGDPCTINRCNESASGGCIAEQIPGCCNSDGDCEDENACTADRCVNNACEHEDICGQ